MENRYIKLSVVKVNDNEVTFKIAKQTHIEHEFCRQINTNKFIASNGYTLASYDLPAFDSELHVLFCQGKLVDSDDDEIDCNFEDFAKICEAITEYNTTNGKGYRIWPQIGDKYYFISSYAEVLSYNFDECTIDLELENTGNFYRTFDEASKVAEKIKLLFKNSH